MSRAILKAPVVTQVTTAKIANPTPTTGVCQPLDPVAHQFSGTPTATPGQPPN